MERLRFSRWWLVVAGSLAFGIAGTYQFAWSSIRGPLGAQVGATETALGTVFTVFVVFQTVSQFPAGWVRDRYGPRWPLLVGAVLLGTGYLGTAIAESVSFALLSYGLGGVGAGTVYTVAINTPVKWFTDRRGLATGVVGVSYGGASFLLIPAVRRGIAARFDLTLFALAALSATVVLAAAIVLRDPPGMRLAADGVDEETAASRDGRESSTDDATSSANDSRSSGDDLRPAYTWRETIRTWQFWLLYAVFFVVNGVGLMLIGKAVTFADQFGLVAAVATAAASAIAISDAGGILVGGWASDRLGSVRTVAGSLVLCGLSLGGAVVAGASGIGLAFVALVGGVAFFRAPAFAIFPGMIGRYYGESRSSANYALLYSSKLWGGIFGGTVSSGLIVTLGWSETFALGAIMMVVAGLAMTRIRPVDAG